MLEIDSGMLKFAAWHEAPDWARSALRDWVWGMSRAIDGEEGGGREGAGSWLDEKIEISATDSIFQTFVGLYGNEVVWTGSVVHDDRGARNELSKLGVKPDAFFGLFNTKYGLRGRGIGWAGARHINHFIWGNKQSHPITIALFTRNPAAERHYQALGFRKIGDIYISSFDANRRLYVKVE